MIDIVMTAALRPNILVRTLSSIRKNLHSDDEFRLIVDIAPVPLLPSEKEYMTRKQKEVADIAAFYFPKHNIRCVFDSPQAEALRWSWQNSESSFVLQWEDDWELCQPVYLPAVFLEMLETMTPMAGMLYFDRKGKSVLDYPGYEGKFKRISQNIYLRTKAKSLGGPPAILTQEYIQDVLSILDGKTCLDLFSATPQAQMCLKKWEIGVYVGESGNLVEDIGKPWKEEMGLVMKKDTKRGVTWIPRKK